MELPNIQEKEKDSDPNCNIEVKIADRETKLSDSEKDCEKSKLSEVETVENIEEIEHDPFSQEVSNHKSTPFEAGVNLFKSYIGAGILALPYIFFNTGYLLSSISLLFTAMIVYYSTTLVFELVAHKKEPVAFTSLFKESLGTKLSNLYKFFLASYQFGICVSYTIFFTDFFQIAFKTKDMPGYRVIFACFSLVIIIPMSLINHFHFFVKFSNIGNFLIIFTLLAIIGLDISELINNNEISKNENDLAHFTQLPSFVGVSIFAFECIGNIFPVKNSMKEPEKFKKVFSSISFVVCIIYIFFSILCCIALGSKINQIILMDLEKIQGSFYLFQAMYALALILSYPLQFYPLIIIIEDNKLIKQFINSNNYIRRYSVRIITTLLIFLLAFAIPKFAAFLNLVGAFAGINIQFVFPILAYQIFFKGKIPRWKSGLNITCLVLGVLGSCFGIIDSMKELFTN